MSSVEDKLVFLSHPWGPSCPAYGNGDPAELRPVRQIKNGDTSNTLWFSGSNHIGTHMDFPLHFCDDGKNLSQYEAADFVFEHPVVIHLDQFPKQTLVEPRHVEEFLSKAYLNQKSMAAVDLVLIATGASSYRTTEDYWKNGPGLGIGLADYLRKTFPNYRALGLDAISITSFTKREIGRQVHREFLCQKQTVILIEDMNLEPLNKINPVSVTALPLRLENADGAPATIVAKLS